MPDPLEHFKKAQSLLDKASLEIRAGMALIKDDEQPDTEPAPKPITGLKAVWDGENILVTWSSSTGKEIDIRYRPKGRSGWFSIQEMIHDDRFTPRPLSAEMEEYTIGSVRNDDWEVLIVWGHWDEEKKMFVAEDGTKPVFLDARDEEPVIDDPAPEQPEEPTPDPTELTFAPVTGRQSGAVNLMGIGNDSGVSLPPLTPSGWNTDRVVDPEDLWGKTRIETRAGFYATKNNLACFYNGAWGGMQRGCLIAFDDKLGYKDFPGNPVTGNTQKWEGQDENGRAFRQQPYACWYMNGKFYVIYGDRAGDYDGIRAVGMATTKDFKRFTHISKEKPFFTHNDFARLAPNDIVQDNGNRVYVHGATVYRGRVYVNFRGGQSGTFYRSILISSTTPEDKYSWRLEGEYESDQPPFYFRGKFYKPTAIRRDSEGKRAVGIEVSDSILGGGKVHKVANSFQHKGAGSLNLFAYKGKWHLAWRVQDEGTNIRPMYMIKQK